MRSRADMTLFSCRFAIKMETSHVIYLTGSARRWSPRLAFSRPNFAALHFCSLLLTTPAHNILNQKTVYVSVKKILTWAFDTYGPRKSVTSMDFIPSLVANSTWPVEEDVSSVWLMQVNRNLRATTVFFLIPLSLYFLDNDIIDVKDRPDCWRCHLMTVVQRQLSPRLRHVVHRAFTLVQPTLHTSYQSTKRTIPVMPYMMTKFLGHLGDKVSFKRYLMLRVLPFTR